MRAHLQLTIKEKYPFSCFAYLISPPEPTTLSISETSSSTNLKLYLVLTHNILTIILLELYVAHVSKWKQD